MIADRSPTWRPWLAAAAVYVAFTIVNAWPLLGALNTALPNDTGDPGLIAWGLWWNAHALPFTAHWWNAPIFLPMKGALALSETFLGLAPLTTPLIHLGLTAVETYNVAYLISFPLTALSAHALTRYLTGRHDAALLAGLAFGFSPYRASQIPHLHLLFTMWMPLGLLALHRYLASRRKRDLLLFGVCWLMNGYTTAYYFVFFAVLVGLWMAWFVRTRRDWLALLTTMAVASLPIVPLIIGYKHYLGLLGFSRGQSEIEQFSADLTAFWTVSPHLWLPYHWSAVANAEGELYPGIAIIVLTLLGVIAGWRRSASPRPLFVQRVFLAIGAAGVGIALISWLSGGFHVRLGGLEISATRPYRPLGIGIWGLLAGLLCDRRLIELWRRRPTFLFYAAGALAMAFFALGPVVHAFGVRVMYPGPYFWLMKLPGGDSLRVPARFGMLCMLCLSQAAAMAYARLTPKGARWGTTGLVALAIALDGWVPSLLLAPVPRTLTLAGIDQNTPVIELPMLDLYSDTTAMLRATDHGHPLVNGFSGYTPPHYDALQEGMNTRDPSVIAALQQFGPLIVLVNRDADVDGKQARFVGEAPQAERLFRSPLGQLFRFPQRPPAPVLDPGRPLPIASIRANVNGGSSLAMVDGDPRTIWQTDGPQEAGDSVALTFDRPVTIRRIEMDLTYYATHFPHWLRITASSMSGDMVLVHDTDEFLPPTAAAVGHPGLALSTECDTCGPPVTIWEGSTGGAAMLGAFRDNIRMPVVIDIPASAPARRFVMTLTASEEKASWTVAELKAFGQ